MIIQKLNILKKTIAIILVIGLVFSCTESKENCVKTIDHTYSASGIINDVPINFGYNQKQSSLVLNFDENNENYNQQYQFGSNGQLVEKRGANFFSEEEVYRFDINNTISEFRKLVQLDNEKKSLQEFIRYKNGIIDNSNSHYFEFTIIDSTTNSFIVQLAYLGGFAVDSIHILNNDFEYYLEELDTNKILYNSNKQDFIFTIEKHLIYDEELSFYQLNANLFFSNTNQLIHPFDSTSSDLKSQSIMLRRLKKDIRIGTSENLIHK